MNQKKYDMIITNPPFFIDSLQSPYPGKNRARHTSLLSRQELIAAVKHLLSSDGIFLIILPAEETGKLILLAETAGLYIRKQMKIKPKAGKPVNRILSGFGFHSDADPSLEELVIRNEDNSFTKEYVTFTEPYYFSLQ
jgi:tRNA1Val (adenine37-N6)-methyltransferase